MSAPSIFIVGPEGSGTTLVYSCVSRHPDLQQHEKWIAPLRDRPLPPHAAIVHLSLPTLRPMRWVAASDLPDGIKVILVRRSPLHTIYSAYRRFFRGNPGRAWQNYFRAVALESEYIARHDPLCIFYEDLVHNSAKVLRAIYEYIGVDSEFRPSIELRNRNDERWARDATFAAVVQRRGQSVKVVESATQADEAVLAQSFRCFGVTVRIEDASGENLSAAVRELLPPVVESVRDEAPQATYRIERSRPRADGTVGYRVRSQGRVLLRARLRERIVHGLSAEIDRLVSESSPRGLFVHAGVVGWRGRAIVIPGRTMSGKSTLVAELVRLGATYYSDEFAVLDEDGRVHPYARTPVLRDGGAADFDRGAAKDPLPIGLIVSTTFRPGVTWQPEELRGARAALPIIDNTITAREESARLVRLAAKIGTSAFCLRGARPAAAETAPKLLAYVDAIAAGEVSPGPGSLVERAIAVLDAAAAPEIGRPPLT